VNEQQPFVAADLSAECIDCQCFTWHSADESAATKGLQNAQNESKNQRLISVFCVISG
jgi:PIN domain nuclease of toxin-antitoxin system